MIEKYSNTCNFLSIESDPIDFIIKEGREQAMKHVSEVKAMDGISMKVIADIVKMRTLELELAASDVRHKFLRNQ